MRTLRNALTLILLAFPSLAFAQAADPLPAATATPDPCAPTPTPKPPPPPHVKGTAEAGATVTSGNTTVQTYTGALKVDGAWPTWGFALRSSGVYGRVRSTQTAGSWDASLRMDRQIFLSLSGYGRLSIDGDRFKGIENRKGAGGGLAWLALRRKGAGFDTDVLRAEIGYQYYREDRVAPAEDDDISAARGFVGYAHAFSKDSVFSEEAEALYDFKTDDRYLLTSITALTVRLSARVAFKASETIKVDTVPAYRDPAMPALGRFEKTDTVTSAAIIVGF